MRDLHCALLTQRELTSREVGQELLRTLIEAHADLVPVRFGNYEPLKGRWQPGSDLASVLDAWILPCFLWKNGRRAEGSAWFAYQGRQHTKINWTCSSSHVNPSAAAALVRELALSTDADLAYVYPGHETREQCLARYKAVYPMYLGVTTHELKLSLPELPWFVVFGQPYVELFGRERLASLPVDAVAELPSGHVQIRLTSDAPSRKGDASAYEALREKVKALLGPEHFLDLASPNSQRRAPAFEWAPDVPNPLLEHLTRNQLLES